MLTAETPINRQVPAIVRYFALHDEETVMGGDAGTNASLIADALWTLGGSPADFDFEDVKRHARSLTVGAFDILLQEIQYEFENIWMVAPRHASLAPWLTALDILSRVDRSVMQAAPTPLTDAHAHRQFTANVPLRLPPAHPDVSRAWEQLFAEAAAAQGDWSAWATHHFRATAE